MAPDAVTNFVHRYQIPVETVLTDPALVLESRERLQALINGLERQQLPTERYVTLLSGLR